MPPTRRAHYEARLQTLRNERSSWEQPWREIAEQMVPYRVVWSGKNDRNRGEKKESQILNNAPVRALNTLCAGMMAGITSPARPWFILDTIDPDLAKFPRVKNHLDTVRQMMLDAMLSSSWYPSLSNGVYPDIGSIATSAMFAEESDDGIAFNSLPIGQYFLDIDHTGKVDTCFRDFQMTVRQMVQKFGRDACSSLVRAAYDQGNYGQGVRVIHAIMPNDEYESGISGRRGMKWASCWWESSDGRSEFLREAGYEEFPILAPRWFARPGDVYGRGPGWEIRGDCRMLQHHEKRLMQMLDKTVAPPMVGSDNIKRASLLSGDMTEVPAGQTGTYGPAITINPQAIPALIEHIARTEKRIESALYVDLWRSLIDDERNQRPTATEINAKRQEIMLMLGPVLENIDDSLLEPAVTRMYNVLFRAGRFPPPPPELQGQTLKIKFVSIMHQAQQETNLVGLRTLVNETAQLGTVRPDALDKLNVDNIIDRIAAITGVNPDVVLSQEDVDKVRAARAAHAQQQAQGQAMLDATHGVKNLSSADPEKLSQLASMLPTVAAAQGAGQGSTP